MRPYIDEATETRQALKEIVGKKIMIANIGPDSQRLTLIFDDNVAVEFYNNAARTEMLACMSYPDSTSRR